MQVSSHADTTSFNENLKISLEQYETPFQFISCDEAAF
jgi:hypothetical protein